MPEINVQSIMKELLKNYAPEYGKDDASVDMLVNMASSFIPKINVNTIPPSQPPTSTATQPSTSKATQPSTVNNTKPKVDLFTNNDSNINAFNNLFQNIHISKNTSNTSNTLMNKSPYQLINQLYNILWNNSDLSSLKNLYDVDASLSLTSEVNEMNQWEMKGCDKVLEYYKNYWLPNVKNQDTFVCSFSFKLNDPPESNVPTYCFVEYTIEQTQLDMNSMRWRKYLITMNDRLELVNTSSDNYHLLSHQMLVKNKTPLD